MLIDITFSQPSQSKNNSDVAVSNRSFPGNSREIKPTTESYNEITKRNIASSVISGKIPMGKSSSFNEVLLPSPESDMELERS